MVSGQVIQSAMRGVSVDTFYSKESMKIGTKYPSIRIGQHLNSLAPEALVVW